MDLIIIILPLAVLIAAVVIGSIVFLHVGTIMTWTKIMNAIERRFPRKNQ